jgi:hypothetical protein
MVKLLTSNTIAALGCAPHSGWAAVIGLGEDGGHLRVLVRERIAMADASDREAKQPYHAVERLPIGQAAERLAAYATTAELMARQGVQRIVDQLSRGGYRGIGLGILESAGRKGSALGNILASHALIHTADGDHFRNAIAAAASRCGLPAFRVRARELDANATEAIGKPIETLQLVLKGVGRDMGPPWGADQKAAALLAWLVLARASAQGRLASSRVPATIA